MANVSVPVPPSDFPSDVLKWMKQNAEPKMAVKLMKCHKYFQHKEFPYEVITEIEYYSRTEECYYVTLNHQKHTQKGLKYIVNNAKKLWITYQLYLIYQPNLASLIIPKIAVCDIKRLTLKQQKITFDEFKFLTASGNVRVLYCRDTILKFENGDPVYLNTVLQCVPNVEHFDFYNGDVPFLPPDFINTFQKINTTKLNRIRLNMISYPYFEIFSKFMDHNPHIYYRCCFIQNSLSPAEMKKLIDYVEDILEAGITEYPPQSIRFPGQPYEQSEALDELIRWFC